MPIPSIKSGLMYIQNESLVEAIILDIIYYQIEIDLSDLIDILQTTNIDEPLKRDQKDADKTTAEKESPEKKSPVREN